MHQREDEHHRRRDAAADMSPDSGGEPPQRTKPAEDEKNAHNASWLMDEIERLWFHDNVVDFHFGSWIASVVADACAPLMPSSSASSSPSLPRAGRIAVAGASAGSLTAPPQLLAQEVVEQGLRSLRDRGKVFSTGDLPHARLKKLTCQGTLDEEEQSPGDPSSPRPALDLPGDAIDGFEFTVKTLETIPSESTLTLETSPSSATQSGMAQTTKPRRRRRRERRKLTKSLSELEFDELRGFRDLGFKLTEDNLTPRVVSLIPALSTSSASPTRTAEAGDLTCSARTNSDTAVAAATTRQMERIYPSHAWNIRRPDSPLLNLRIPNPNREEVDMKAHLRFWARAVASTVRQEC